MPRQPGPWTKRALRAPVALYDLGAGPLFGHRFLLLTHRGRRSGRLYRTMLEVVSWDGDRTEAVVMSGLGKHSNWYLNLDAGGAEEVRIARLRFRPEARVLAPEEAARTVAGYEHRNRLIAPIVRRVLSRLVDFRYDGSEQARQRLVSELPLLGLSPAAESDRR